MEKDYVFLDYLRSKLSKSTVTTYRYARQQMINTVGEEVNELTIAQYWEAKRPCKVTKAMLKHLCDFSGLNIPLVSPSIKNKIRLPKYYSSDETKQILEAIKEDCDYYEVVWLLIEGGLRIGEAVSLRWTDIKYLETPARIFVPAQKGNTDRYVYPSPELVNALMAKERINAYVFPSPVCEGSHITPQAVRYHYRRIKERLSLSDDSSPHKHRHTYATTMLRNKVGLRTIQTALGHASVSTTSLYTHVFPEEVQEGSKHTWINNG